MSKGRAPKGNRRKTRDTRSKPQTEPAVSPGRTSRESLQWGKYAVSATALLLATQVVWALVQPHDAVGVFRGNALPQNLLWLVTGCAAALAGLAGGLRLKLAVWQWAFLLGLLVSFVVTTVCAGSENNPRTAWFGFWQVISILAAFAITRAFATCTAHRTLLIGLLLTGGVGLSCHGLFQAFVTMPAARAEYLQDPDAFLAGNPEVDAPAGSPARKRFEDRFLSSKEPLATFALTNSLAVVLTVVLVLAVGCLFVQPDDGAGAGRGYMELGCVFLIVALVGCTWFLTRSRTAYIALAAALVYLWAMSRLSRRKWSFGAHGKWAVVAVVLLFAFGVIWLVGNDRLVLSESLYSLRFRLDYWYGSVALLQEQWLCGVGLGNFQAYYPQYMLETASETIADPHNWFFDIATALGLPAAFALGAFLLFVLLPRAEAVSASAASTSGDQLDASNSMLAGAIGGGGLVVGVLSSIGGLEAGPLVFGFAVGGVIAFALRRRLRSVVSNHPVVLQAMAFSIVVCLLATGSWQASGLAVPAVVVIALSVSMGRPASDQLGEGTPRSSGVYGVAPVLLAFVGLGVFALQTWTPVTKGWLLSQQISYSTSTTRQLDLSRQWQDADSLDSSADSIEAQILVGQAMSDRAAFEQSHSAAVDAVASWLTRDSRPFGNWQLASSLMLDLASAAQQSGKEPELDELLGRAAEYSGEAVTRYPSSAGLNLQAALCHRMLGDGPAAEAFLAEAERLSEQTPHEDKKLSAQQVYLPPVLGALVGQNALGGDGRWNAELVQAWLRKQ